MNDSKSIDENVDDFLKLVADLNNLGVEVSEEVQAILLLSLLPYKYDQLKETLKYGRDILRLNKVTGAAKSKERELIESGRASSSQGEGLYVVARGRGKSQQGRGKSRGRGRSQPRPRYNKSDTGCFICGSEDHWKWDCPERNTKKPTKSSNLAAEYKEPLMLTVGTQDTKKEWVMDSGCTFHSTPDKEVLFDFKELNGGRVLMANNTHEHIKGTWNIRIQNQDGSEVILTDVKYMPEVRRNLISYGMLEKSGCTYEGRDLTVRFYKDNKKVISGKYHKGLYYLQGAVSKAKKMSPETKEAEQRLRKKNSKKVTFSDNLVQGPTPHGLTTSGSSTQGGEYYNGVKEDSGCVAYALATPREIDAEPKTHEEARKSKDEKHGKNAEKEPKLAGSKRFVNSKPGLLGAIEKQEFNARVVAKGFSKVDNIKDLVSNRDVVLSKKFASNQAAIFRKESVPEQKLQVCCDLIHSV